jgi:hypothetical protein
MLATALLVLSAALGDPASVRVSAGAADVVESGRVRALGPRTEQLAIMGAAWLEVGPGSAVELAWRGRASARVQGGAALALGPGTSLALERYEVLELEVRRGGFVLELPELGRVELMAGVLQLRALPHGVHELRNRGGAALELVRPGRPSLTVAPGGRVRLRAGA